MSAQVITDSSWPGSGNSTFDRKKAVEKLVRGREVTERLQALLNAQPEALLPSDPDDHGSSSSRDDLVEKILGSFTETISLLVNRKASHDDDDGNDEDEVSQVPADSPSPCGGRKFEGSSEEGSKTSAFRDRRGCYKRRKTSQSWTRVSPTLVDDGHAWRKYGQKVILNTNYPRNYFRCTHKYDQGCQATKQVQRTEDDPPMFRTTYYGHHTCNHVLKAPQIFLDSSINLPVPAACPKDSSSVLLNFEVGSSNNIPTSKPSPRDHPSFVSSPFSLIKQEYHHHNEDHNKPIALNTDHHRSLPPSASGPHNNYFLSPNDQTAYGSSRPISVLSSGSDHGDVISSGVYSCTASTGSHNLDLDLDMGLGLDMDMDMGAVDFDDSWTFEFS